MKGKRTGNINIGTVIFGALFLYLVIMIIVYMLTDHVSSYMVTSGTLSRNETYTALVLRQEQIARAPADGYVNYYVNESGKAARGSVVCSITGNQSELTTVRLSESDQGAVRRLASQFSRNFDPNRYSAVYDLKYAMNSTVVNNANAGTVSGMVSEAVSDGIITYSMDGKEDLTVDTATAEDIRGGNAQATTLRTDGQVAAGDPLYRVISSERWSVLFPISDRQYAGLSAKQTVRVRFARDGQTETGDLSLLDRDGTHYALVSFYSGMIRYCSERYLEIELVTNTNSGLKLPLSAIVTKEFYTVPASYLSHDGENGEAGFYVSVRGEGGKQESVFTEAELYEKTKPSGASDDAEDVYYVDPLVFHRGDVILRPDTKASYIIGESASLEGVYCTNRGYAVFRKIEIIDQNEDACIVRTGTTYGLSQYDYIVRDGSKVKESQIVTKAPKV